MGAEARKGRMITAQTKTPGDDSPGAGFSPGAGWDQKERSTRSLVETLLLLSPL